MINDRDLLVGWKRYEKIRENGATAGRVMFTYHCHIATFTAQEKTGIIC